MTNKVISNLEQKLLIAMPSVADPMFKRVVMYVYEHDANGAMAFIVSRALSITIGDILRQLNMDILDDKPNQVNILQGGPVCREQMYIVQYSQDETADPNITDPAEQPLALVQPQELLDNFAHGELLDISLPFLGYSGWGAGQLEREIVNNDWLICPATRALLFDTPPDQRWVAAMKFLGVNPDHLTDYSGNA